MTFKSVCRFDPVWPKLRLFRVMWTVGNVGFGGYSRKVAVALRPKLFAFNRNHDDWRLTVAGVEIHSDKSWGGRHV